MSSRDDAEDMVDEEMHAELRDALVGILDALAKLSRDDRVKVMTCARQFFELPRSE